MINNRIPTSLPERNVQGRLAGGWNSGSRGWDGLATADVRAGNWVLHGDLFGRKDHDYELPDGGRQANEDRGHGDGRPPLPPHAGGLVLCFCFCL